MTVKIIGAGLAGSEAAWHLAQKDIEVELYEMRPEVSTKAHQTGLCSELVCSNSLKSNALDNAAGLLKEEMRLLGSLTMEAAKVAEVPAGQALAVDRMVFSEYIDQKIKNHPKIKFINQELDFVPKSTKNEPVIIATGPLSSPAITEKIIKLTGSGKLSFFDAIAPIFFAESLDLKVLYKMSRYGKGGDDYYNIPLNKEEYQNFIGEILAAEKYVGNVEVESDSLDKLCFFDGCMPIEDLIEKGPETLRFGPLKPKGLIDPRTDKMPHAVIQLRQDDKEAHTWSMVGMQTRMKRHEQERIIKTLPGMQNVEFARYGSFHRNTFIDSPKCLDATLQLRSKPSVFFAGQITGTEGYIESAVGGIIAGINAARLINKKKPLVFPMHTATGSLFKYISNPERKDFQPINITYGIMETYHKIELKGRKNKKLKRQMCSDMAMVKMKEFLYEF